MSSIENAIEWFAFRLAVYLAVACVAGVVGVVALVVIGGT